MTTRAKHPATAIPPLTRRSKMVSPTFLGEGSRWGEVFPETHQSRFLPFTRARLPRRVVLAVRWPKVLPVALGFWG